MWLQNRIGNHRFIGMFEELVYLFIAPIQNLVEGYVPSTHQESGGSDSSANKWKHSPAQQSPGQRSLGASCRTGWPEEHVQGGLAVPGLNGQVHGRDPQAHVQTAACIPWMVAVVLATQNLDPNISRFTIFSLEWAITEEKMEHNLNIQTCLDTLFVSKQMFPSTCVCPRHLCTAQLFSPGHS